MASANWQRQRAAARYGVVVHWGEPPPTANQGDCGRPPTPRAARYNEHGLSRGRRVDPCTQMGTALAVSSQRSYLLQLSWRNREQGMNENRIDAGGQMEPPGGYEHA